MILPTVYTPHSYITYAIDGSVIPTTQTVFSFPKNFLRQDHIHVYHRPGVGQAWAEVTSGGGANWTFSGTSGSGTLTLAGGFPARTAGDDIRIRRITPDTQAGRLVDYAPGSLSEEDLDTAHLQLLFCVQEARDAVDLFMTREVTSEVSWNANWFRIGFVGAPVYQDDAVRLSDLQAVQLAAGALPTPQPSDQGSLLVVDSGGNWAITTPTNYFVAIGFGFASLFNVGLGSNELPTTGLADTRYLQIGNNLSELVATNATARANLGLALTSITPMGVGANQVVQMTAAAKYPAADGSLIDISANPSVNATGKYECVYVSDIGDSAQAINSGAYQSLTNNGGAQAQHNGGSADVTIDTGAKRWALLGPATYWINVVLTVRNESAANNAGFIFKIRRNVTGAPSDIYVSPAAGLQIQPRTGANYHYLTLHREVMLALAATESIDVQAALITAITGDARIVEGHISIRRVG